MSLKILFLNYHQGIFLENFEALNNKHGKCFHYDTSSNGEDISGLIEFTDVGGVLPVSNKRFSSLKHEISQNLLYSAMDLHKGWRRRYPWLQTGQCC